MTIQTTYNSIPRSVWTEMVRKSPTGNWFQTPEAYDFYASQPELFKPFVVGVASLQQCSTDGHRQSDRAKLFTHKGKRGNSVQAGAHGAAL